MLLWGFAEQLWAITYKLQSFQSGGEKNHLLPHIPWWCGVALLQTEVRVWKEGVAPKSCNDILAAIPPNMVPIRLSLVVEIPALQRMPRLDSIKSASAATFTIHFRIPSTKFDYIQTVSAKKCIFTKQFILPYRALLAQQLGLSLWGLDNIISCWARRCQSYSLHIYHFYFCLVFHCVSPWFLWSTALPISWELLLFTWQH